MFWIYAAAAMTDIDHFNEALALINDFLARIDLPPYEEQPFTPLPMLTSAYSNAEMEERARNIHQYEMLIFRYQKLREYGENLLSHNPVCNLFIHNELFPLLDIQTKKYECLAAPSKLYFLSCDIANISVHYGNIISTSLCEWLFTFQYIDGKYHEKDMSPEHQALIRAYRAPIHITPIAPEPLNRLSRVSIFAHNITEYASQCSKKLFSLMEPIRVILNDHPHLPSEEIKIKFAEQYQQVYGSIPPELQDARNVNQLLDNIIRLVNEKQHHMEEFIDYTQNHLFTLRFN